jgi:hypothetical protein
LQFRLAFRQLFAERAKITFRLAQFREKLLLFFLDMMAHHLARHLEGRIEALVARLQRFKLRDECLDEEVFDIRFIDVNLRESVTVVRPGR